MFRKLLKEYKCLWYNKRVYEARHHNTLPGTLDFGASFEVTMLQAGRLVIQRWFPCRDKISLFISCSQVLALTHLLIE